MESVFLLIILAISIIAILELGIISKAKGIFVNRFILILFCVLILVANFVFVNNNWDFQTNKLIDIYKYLFYFMSIAIVFLVVIFIIETFKKDFSKSLEKISISTLIFMYCGFFISLIYLIKNV